MNESARHQASNTSTIGVLLPGVLTYKNAGLTGSAIARTTALSKTGINSTLLTHVWQPFIATEIEALVRSKRLLETIEVRNLFTDLECRFGNHEPEQHRYKIADYLTPSAFRNSPLGGHLPDEAIRRIETSFHPTGSSLNNVSITFESNNRLRLLADGSGFMTRYQFLDTEGTVAEDVYLDRSGRPYLKYGKDRQNNTGYQIIKEQAEWHWVGNKEALIALWIKTCFDAKPLRAIISELAPHALHIDALAEIASTTSITTVLALHSNHLTPPFRNPANVRKEFDSVFKRLSDIDALVVLTEQQRIDILKQYGNPELLHVIPHSVEENRSRGTSPTDRTLAVIVSRVDPGKGHIPLIRSIAKNRKQWLGYRVEIWGSGQLVHEVETAIAEEDVTDIVHYCGFTTDPHEVYARAAIALFPNTKEAQPLSVLEAMAAGATPIAFDFKYGARAMINDCDTGLLIDPDDFQDLSNSALTLLKNETLRDNYSKRAQESSTGRTPEQLGQDWAELFNDLQRR